MIDKPLSPSLPTPVRRAIEKLGADLALARRRRHLTQASMAERLRVSEATVRRMEHGDSGISLGTIAQAFFVLGELDKINRLLDSAADDIGLSLMNAQLPLRVRKKRIKSDSGVL
ncbi:MAG TPA: helix-turn-helix transcriptional regulator [Trinickia sp.]|uniref:helix-turn-helix transcriptional regulator n=1 Tax=Trinickia sp. TaxID=2571163 RepID=UPI002C519AA4|nr:helix-turn-helix transcriptional regulator [Trinickia sp.]HVW53647.1 helix-turn-helix transcriptional regulator [Trinickia sp.]